MAPLEPIHHYQFIRGLAKLDGCLQAVERERGADVKRLSSSEMLTDALQYNLKSCVWSIQQFGAFIRRSADDQPPAPGQLKSMAWHLSFEAHLAIDQFLTSAFSYTHR